MQQFSNKLFSTGKKQQQVFGIPLEALLKRENSRIPSIVRAICTYIRDEAIDCEGIFRVNGNNKTMNEIKSLFNEHTVVNFDQFHDNYAIAGVLKLFFRDLPDGIISEQLTLRFVEIAETADDDLLDQLRDLLLELPESHYDVLKYLCNFLVSVSDNGLVNKMTPTSLAICFAPNIFRCGDTLQGLKIQGMANKIMVQFIENYCHIFDFNDEHPQEEEQNSPLFAPKVVMVEACSAEHPIKTSFQLPVQHNNNTPQPKPRGSSSSHDFNGSGNHMRLSDEEYRVSSPISLDQPSPRPQSAVNDVFPFSDMINQTIHSVINCHTFGSDSPHRSDNDEESLTPTPEHKVQPRAKRSKQRITYGSKTLPSKLKRSSADSNGSIPKLDLSTLYVEPDIQQRSMYDNLDGDLIPQPVANEEESPTPEQVKSMSRLVQSLQRKITQYENDFETYRGHKPSKQEKQQDPEIRAVMQQLTQTRKELKLARSRLSTASNHKVTSPTITTTSSRPVSCQDTTPPTTVSSMRRDSTKSDQTSLLHTVPASSNSKSRTMSSGSSEMLEIMYSRLADKRLQAGRPEDLSLMTYSQVQEEKLALQKVLLSYENHHGRPQTRQVKDLMKPIYDRYRQVKRLLSDGGPPVTSTPSTSTTIHSIHVPSSGYDWSTNTSSSPTHHHQQQQHQQVLLQEELRQLKDEKFRLQRHLKNFEHEFERTTGQKVDRVDRLPMQNDYRRYKEIKTRLKELEATL